jgi:hypothetical protein
MTVSAGVSTSLSGNGGEMAAMPKEIRKKLEPIELETIMHPTPRSLVVCTGMRPDLRPPPKLLR